MAFLKSTDYNPKSASVWKAINENPGRKNCNKSMGKPPKDSEWLKLWKGKHSQDLLGDALKIDDEETTPSSLRS